jgi:hypothetical protein
MVLMQDWMKLQESRTQSLSKGQGVHGSKISLRASRREQPRAEDFLIQGLGQGMRETEVGDSWSRRVSGVQPLSSSGEAEESFGTLRPHVRGSRSSSDKSSSVQVGSRAPRKGVAIGTVTTKRGSVIRRHLCRSGGPSGKS